jgi:hypothetical protein
VNKFQIGRPLVIEETFPMMCRPAELRDFIRSTKSRACGWLSFYWGQMPAELKPSDQPGDKLSREWLELFREM